MATFRLTIEASVNAATGNAPVLEILLNGSPVASSLGITAVTGVGSDLLMFTLEFDDSVNPYPSSLSFRFNAGSGDGGDVVTINTVRINGQAIDVATALSTTTVSQGQTASLSSPAAHDHLFGRAEPTVGDLGTPTLTGTGGDDNLKGKNSKDDIIDGGNGNDRLRGMDGDDAIYGGDGDDHIFGENGNDIIIGGAGNDRLVGNDGDDLLHGGADNDTLMGGSGNDLLNGGAGNDILIGEDGDDILYGEDGDDRLIGVRGNNIMYGDGGNDILLGGINDDLMYGGDGNDQIHGGNGNDTIYGDDGNDLITGGNGNDTISGGAGDDLIFGGAGNDTISGGADNDNLFGDDGDDTLNGEGGDDNLVGGSGADTLNGGAGNDLLQGSGLTSFEVSAILRANPGVVFSQETNSFYQLVSSNATFVGAQGVAGAATLSGVAGHLVTISSAIENAFVQNLAAGNTIWINASDSGMEGEWRWAGGQEDGLLIWNGDQTGSAQNGFFTNWAAGQPGGGASNDAAVMLANGTWDDVSASGNRFFIIEWDGASFSDDNAADTLNGGDGDDLLFGHGGNDILNGDAGIDHLFGGAGNDVMHGGGGNDFLYDDAGANEFYGDAGDDVLDARFQTAIPSIASQITTLLAENAGLNYSADTGNFYMLVTGNYTFAQALAGSASNLINGVGGHLVTITSAAENTLVSTLRLGNTIWLAASDDTAYTGDAEGEWYWVDGPEAGTKFWTGGLSGSAFGGMFTAWDNNEPNDYVGGEDFATMWQGGDRWNDDGPPNNNSFRARYMVEWEGTDLLVTPPVEAAQAGQIMYGGTGNDIVYGGNGDDTIYGDEDNDVLYGFIGSDTIYGGAGADVLYAHDDPGATAVPLNATFTSGADSFTYADGFTGVGGSDPGSVDVTGSWINTDGYAPGSGNGCVQIYMNSTGNPTGPISGNYSITVNLTTAMSSAQLSFAYRMNLFTAADAGENLYLYATVDGTTYGTGGNNWVDSRLGNTTEGDSGWLTVTLDLGGLTTGNHTIRLGLYVNDVSDSGEDAWIRFDDVVLSNAGAASEDPGAVNILNGGDGNDTLYGSTAADILNGDAGNDTLRSGSTIVYSPVTELNASFNANEDSFSYADGFTGVGGSDPGSVDVTGSWINTDGYAPGSGNGCVQIYMDSTGNPTGPISGNYSITVNVAEAMINSQLTFAYRMNLFTAADAGENLYLYATVDGTTYGTGGNNWVNSRLGNTTEGDSGWLTVTLDIGNLSAGSHTIRLGLYVNDVSDSSEDAWVRFDDVVLTGDTNSAPFTTLNGGAGNDSLYGSDGEDVFAFSHTGAANTDNVYNFDSTIDKINLTDLLSGYDPLSDAITDFVRITDSGGNSDLRVDTTGSGSFGAGTVVATIIGVTGLTDEAALVSSGSLIVS